VPATLEGQLVVAISSRALFDFEEENRLFEAGDHIGGHVDTHDVELKEKGYLVAGVSGFGSATKALILVVSAEIK